MRSLSGQYIDISTFKRLNMSLCRCALAEPLAAKRQRVAALIERLALQSCADTTIGDALSRGISGGQASLIVLTWCLHELTGADGVAAWASDRSKRREL